MKSSTERRSGRRSKTGSEEDVTEGTVPEKGALEEADLE